MKMITTIIVGVAIYSTRLHIKYAFRDKFNYSAIIVDRGAANSNIWSCPALNNSN